MLPVWLGEHQRERLCESYVYVGSMRVVFNFGYNFVTVITQRQRKRFLTKSIDYLTPSHPVSCVFLIATLSSIDIDS